VRFNVGAFENVSAAAEMFCDFFGTVQEHFIAYYRCREGGKAI
jgi:hypothetical protein